MNADSQPTRVLVVDDNPAIHDDIRKTLSPRKAQRALDAAAAELFGEAAAADDDGPPVQIDSAYQGQDALRLVQEAVAEGRPYQIAFTDVRMPPGWDGVETTGRMFEADPALQVVLCTAYSDYSVGQIVQRFGKTDRLLILKKPFDIAEVTLLAAALSEKWRLAQEARRVIASQGDQIIDLESVLKLVQDSHAMLESKASSLTERSDALSCELQRRTVEVLESYETAALALAQLAESRDPETGEHLVRMQEVAQVIATRLATDERYGHQITAKFLFDLHQATPLHDIGKVGIPDSILLKPGRLTTGEFEVMKRHTLIGARALEGLVCKAPETTFLSMAAEIALHHHERWDGGGYPLGIRGEVIPLSARIAAVADVFDALTSDRVYKDAMLPEEARELIQEGAGSQFDPVVVQAFLDCFEQCVEVRHRVDGQRPAALAGP
ncbi:HD domain-containing phosphohydrolase [Botrimarina sp.]|uniref:HD domain-containing phosphohydrolase n=1 Tax=Botrimarina sp. TaxID=2795802 RepID=UPI0032EC7118